MGTDRETRIGVDAGGGGTVKPRGTQASEGATAIQGRQQASWLAQRELLRPRIFLALMAGVFLLLYVSALALQWVVLQHQAVEDARGNASKVTELLVMDLTSTSPLSETLARLDEPGRYERLDRFIRHSLGKFGLIQSKIYDPSGKLVYAYDRALAGQAFPIIAPFRAALSGKVVSRLVTPKEYEERYAVSISAPLVETYVPLRERGKTAYVLETYQDFAPAEARLWHRVRQSGAALAVVMGAALVGLTFAYRWIHRLQIHVQSLERLLPICTACKKIHVDSADAAEPWVAVESYFGERDHLQFTHGMCPECVAKFKLQAAERKGRKQVSSGGGAT